MSRGRGNVRGLDGNESSVRVNLERDADYRRVDIPDIPVIASDIIAVIFEWDGKKPPSSFYRNVRQKLLYVWKRSTKKAEYSELAFWFQESVFLVADERLARLLAGIGAVKGCSRSMILMNGNVYFPNEEDRRKARNLLNVWSRPGPRHFDGEDAKIAKYREDIENALGEKIFGDADVSDGVRYVPSFF